MSTDRPELRPQSALAFAIPLILTLLVALGCSGGSSSPTEPTPTPPPTTNSNSASFAISSGGQSSTMSYNGSNNTVFCTRNAGWASLWIRLARDTAGNGENGPHIDIDVCNHSGGGSFQPQDAMLASCGSGKSFDIFWHAEDASVFATRSGQSNCTLQFTQSGTSLNGTFQCQGLEQQGGSGGSGGTVDVLSGSFQCTETA